MTSDTQGITLTDFLLARIAEDESVAKDVARADTWHLDGDWREDRSELVGGGKILAAFTDEDRMTAHHVVRWSPARVLAECESKRRAIDAAWSDQERIEGEWGSGQRRDQMSAKDDNPVVIELFALPYADHSDYRKEWKP